jgi:hypothetical protein
VTLGIHVCEYQRCRNPDASSFRVAHRSCRHRRNRRSRMRISDAARNLFLIGACGGHFVSLTCPARRQSVDLVAHFHPKRRWRRKDTVYRGAAVVDGRKPWLHVLGEAECWLRQCVKAAPSRDPLNPLAAPGRRLEGIREILCLVHDLTVAKLHNAHCVCGSPLVGDCVFRDP